MQLYSQDYESARELMLGMHLQNAVLNTLTSPTYKWMIGAVMVVGILIHFTKILTKKGSMFGLVGYMVLIPMLAHFALSTGDSVKSIKVPFLPQIQDVVKAKNDAYQTDLSNYQQYRKDVSDGKTQLNSITDANLEASVADSEKAYKSAKSEMDYMIQNPDEVMKTSALFSLMYTMTSAVRWMMADAMARSIYTNPGTGKAIDPNTTAQGQLVMKDMFVNIAKNDKHLSEAQHDMVSRFSSCVNAQAYLKHMLGSSLARMMNTIRAQQSQGVNNFDTIMKSSSMNYDGRMSVLWTEVKQTEQACDGTAEDYLNQIKNDKDIKNRAAKLLSGWHANGALTDSQKKTVSVIFNIPMDQIQSMSDQNLALLLAEYQESTEISKDVENDTQASVDNLSNGLSNYSPSGGYEEKATSFLANALSGFAMYGKTLSMESYHFVLWLAPVAFVFAVLGGMIPGLHSKMLVGFFVALMYLQMWGLGYSLVDLYYGNQFSKSMQAQAKIMPTAHNFSITNDVESFWHDLGVGASAIKNRIEGNSTNMFVAGAGSLFVGKAVAKTATNKAFWKGIRSFLGDYAAELGVGGAITAGVTTIGAVAAGAALAIAHEGSATISAQNAQLQEVAGNLARMNPITQSVYSGMLQWQNNRMQHTIRDIKVVEASLYTMVPLIVGIVFFGFYKIAGGLDLGQRGAQMGQMTAGAAMMAVRGIRAPRVKPKDGDD